MQKLLLNAVSVSVAPATQVVVGVCYVRRNLRHWRDRRAADEISQVPRNLYNRAFCFTSAPFIGMTVLMGPHQRARSKFQSVYIFVYIIEESK